MNKDEWGDDGWDNNWKNQNVNSTWRNDQWKYQNNNSIDPLPSFKWLFVIYGGLFVCMMLGSIPMFQSLLVGLMGLFMIGLFVSMPLMFVYGYTKERHEAGKWVPCSLVTAVELFDFMVFKKWEDEDQIGPEESGNRSRLRGASRIKSRNGS